MIEKIKQCNEERSMRRSYILWHYKSIISKIYVKKLSEKY